MGKWILFFLVLVGSFLLWEGLSLIESWFMQMNPNLTLVLFTFFIMGLCVIVGRVQRRDETDTLTPWQALGLFASVAVPPAVAVGTFLFSPSLEMAMAKINLRLFNSAILFNPNDFRGTGENGVQRLLQELAKSDADLGCISKALEAIGAGPDSVLCTEGVKLMLEKLRKDQASFEEVVVFCSTVGRPMLPVLVEMARDDRSGPMWEGLCALKVDAPRVESFVPAVIDRLSRVRLVPEQDLQVQERKNWDETGGALLRRW